MSAASHIFCVDDGLFCEVVAEEQHVVAEGAAPVVPRMVSGAGGELMMDALFGKCFVELCVDLKEEVFSATVDDELQGAVLELWQLAYDGIVFPVFLVGFLLSETQLDVPTVGERAEVNASAHRSGSTESVLVADGEVECSVAAHA